MVDVPRLVQIPPNFAPTKILGEIRQWSIAPTVFRAWAGQYGVEQGLTKFRRYDVHGRPEYFDPPAQSSFRHVIVHAALYLDHYNTQINLGARVSASSGFHSAKNASRTADWRRKPITQSIGKPPKASPSPIGSNATTVCSESPGAM